jgi:hypothetical protein
MSAPLSVLGFLGVLRSVMTHLSFSPSSSSSLTPTVYYGVYAAEADGTEKKLQWEHSLGLSQANVTEQTSIIGLSHALYDEDEIMEERHSWKTVDLTLYLGARGAEWTPLSTRLNSDDPVSSIPEDTAGSATRYIDVVSSQPRRPLASLLPA